MRLADRRQPVVDAPAQRQGDVQRLGLDPAERSEQRQHAHRDPLAVHAREMEIDVIEGGGDRLFAHPPGLQHLDAVPIAHDARFLAAGAQGVGDFGGLPMGVHVDHGRVLHRFSSSLTPWRRAAMDDGGRGKRVKGARPELCPRPSPGQALDPPRGLCPPGPPAKAAPLQSIRWRGWTGGGTVSAMGAARPTIVGRAAPLPGYVPPPVQPLQ